MLLLALFQLSLATAQKSPQNDYVNPHIQASGTHFGAPVTDRKWGNINGDSFTAAKFLAYSGQSYVLLKVSQPVQIELETRVELKSGTLDFVLLAEDGTPIYGQQLSQSAQDKAQMALPAAGTYRLVFTGNQARGSYSSQWREL